MVIWKDAIAYADSEAAFKALVEDSRVTAIVAYDNERLCFYANGFAFKAIVGP